MQLLHNKNDGTLMVNINICLFDFCGAYYSLCQAYPPVEDPICLVGLRPFFGVEHLLVSESYLCLLACADTSTSSQE
jgi:hypothetical protein